MRTFTALLILLSLCACDTRERDFRPPVRIAKSRQAIPPPPPPPPRDPEGDGPAPVPEAIASFFANGKGGNVFVNGQRLSPELAANTIGILSSPRSYTDNHFLCTDPGIRLRVQRGAASLDLIVGLECRHVHDGESREEIGFLSTSGQEFFVQLARGLH